MLCHSQGPTSRVSPISGRFGSDVEVKSWVAGWLGSGSCVEIFDQIDWIDLFFNGNWRSLKVDSDESRACLVHSQLFGQMGLGWMDGYHRFR